MLLAIDTSGPFCSACLWDGQSFHSISEELGRGHAERLMPMLEELLAQRSVGWNQLTRIATTTGPGSFTGLRVGLAAARGLSLALDCPCIGVTVLEAYAFGVEGPVAVVQDAKRNQIWMQVFNPTHEPAAVSIEDVPKAIASDVHHLAGSGAHLVKELDDRFTILDNRASPSIESVAQIALTRPSSTKHPSPLYLRAPDAKPQQSALIS